MQEGGRHFTTIAVANLQEVGGDFTLRNVPIFTGQRLYPALRSVGGVLRLDNAVQSTSGLIVGDPWLLTVRSVDVRNNDQPTSVNLHNVEPTPFEPLTFVDNANLCTSSIESWANSRPSWMGTAPLIQSGNDDGC